MRACVCVCVCVCVLECVRSQSQALRRSWVDCRRAAKTAFTRASPPTHCHRQCLVDELFWVDLQVASVRARCWVSALAGHLRQWSLVTTTWRMSTQLTTLTGKTDHTTHWILTRPRPLTYSLLYSRSFATAHAPANHVTSNNFTTDAQQIAADSLVETTHVFSSVSVKLHLRTDGRTNGRTNRLVSLSVRTSVSQMELTRTNERTDEPTDRRRE